MNIPQFTRLTVGGNLGCLWFGVSMNISRIPLGKHKQSFVLDVYPAGELLGQGAGIHLVLEDMPVSQMVVPFHAPNSRV